MVFRTTHCRFVLAAVLSLFLPLALSQPAPDPISDAVGATVGQFKVDENGSASYAIPIYAVPGTAGVSPNIDLI